MDSDLVRVAFQSFLMYSHIYLMADTDDILKKKNKLRLFWSENIQTFRLNNVPLACSSLCVLIHTWYSAACYVSTIYVKHLCVSTVYVKHLCVSTVYVKHQPGSAFSPLIMPVKERGLL